MPEWQAMRFLNFLGLVLTGRRGMVAATPEVRPLVDPSGAALTTGGVLAAWDRLAAMSPEERRVAYTRCRRQGGHVPSGWQNPMDPPLDICTWCGTSWREAVEFNAPMAEKPDANTEGSSVKPEDAPVGRDAAELGSVGPPRPETLEDYIHASSPSSTTPPGLYGWGKNSPMGEISWTARSVTTPAVDAESLTPFERERAAFQQLMALGNLGIYQGQFVAIHQGRVVGAHHSENVLVRDFFRNYGRGASVYIGVVGPRRVVWVPNLLRRVVGDD